MKLKLPNSFTFDLHLIIVDILCSRSGNVQLHRRLAGKLQGDSLASSKDKSQEFAHLASQKSLKILKIIQFLLLP